MIKEIFLPEKIKGRRLFSQRIVGITIQESIITGCRTYIAPGATYLEAAHEERIIEGTAERARERTIEALKRLMIHFPRYDQLCISLPSSLVVFKELTVPFTDPEKIRMIIDYEVEPLLPFSISKAVIDFIITKKNPGQNSSQVLVAAIQEKDVRNLLDLYTEAGIDPTSITIDLLALYGLYLQVPGYKQTGKGSALIDVGSTSTRVAFLLNDELRLIRTIPKGITTIAQQISTETATPVDRVIERLHNTGITNSGDTQYDHKVEKYFVALLNDIQFTLNSFSLKLNFYDEINKMLFVGTGTQISDFVTFAHQTLQISCELFDPEKLLKPKLIKNKVRRPIASWREYAIALATALPYSEHDTFTLRRKSLARTHHPLVIKQMVTAGVLLTAIFGLLGGWGFWQISTLSSLKQKREQDTIRILKKVFHSSSISLKKNSLAPLVKDAQLEIERKKEIWQPFVQEDLQALEILYDLTQAIDKKNFIVSINKLNLHKDETGAPLVSLDGLFKSRSGELYKHWSLFDEHMKTTKILSRKKTSEFDPAQDGTALTFSFKYKLKEK